MRGSLFIAVTTGSVAHLLLQVLAALLRVEGQRGDRAGVETLHADFLVGLFAETVAAFLDPAQVLVDLGNQLAVAIAGAQLERVLGLARCALGLVTHVTDFLAEVVHGLAGFLDELLTPILELVAEISEVARTHVLLVTAGLITLGQVDDSRSRQRVAAVLARDAVVGGIGSCAGHAGLSGLLVSG